MDCLLQEEDASREELAGNYAEALQKYVFAIEKRIACKDTTTYAHAPLMNHAIHLALHVSSTTNSVETCYVCLEVAESVLSKPQAASLPARNNYKSLMYMLYAGYYRKRRKNHAAVVAAEKAVAYMPAFGVPDEYLFVNACHCAQLAGKRDHIAEYLERAVNCLRRPGYSFTACDRFGTSSELETHLLKLLELEAMKRRDPEALADATLRSDSSAFKRSLRPVHTPNDRDRRGSDIILEDASQATPRSVSTPHVLNMSGSLPRAPRPPKTPSSKSRSTAAMTGRSYASKESKELAALKIQSFVRGSLIRKLLAKRALTEGNHKQRLQRKDVIDQAEVRKHHVLFDFSLPSTSFPPSVYRRRWNAAMDIQRVFRGYCVRKIVNFKRRELILYAARGSMQLLSTPRAHHSAASVPASDTPYRLSAVQLVHAHRVERKRQYAATVVQKVFRGHRVRVAVARWRAQLRNDAALAIQCTFRSFRHRMRWMKRADAVLVLQRVFRARWDDPYPLQHMLRLQGLFRGRLHRVQRAEWKRKAQLVRAWVARRLAVSKQILRGTSARQIQSAWRSYRTRCELRRRMAAIATFQAIVRKALTTNILQREHAAACRIQAVARGCLVLRQYRKLVRAATVLKACHKGRVERLRLRLLSALVTWISASFRARKQRRAYLRQLEAIHLLGARMRGCVCRRQLFLKNMFSATLVRFVSKYLMRIRLYRLRQYATKIQRLYRGFVVRKALSQKRNAVRKIISFVRGHLHSSALYKMRMMLKAVIFVQKQWRCVQERRAFQRKRRGVSTIQGWARSTLRLRRESSAAFAIQRWFRQHVAVRKVERIHSAYATIQRCILTHCLSMRYQRLRGASVKIQQAFRCYLHRKRYILVRNAAIRLQHWIVMQRQRHRFMRMRSAVSAIECFWASVCTRKRLSSKQSAAVRLQSVYRAHCTRIRMLAMNTAATLIQSWYRSQSCRMVVHRRSCASGTIANWYRTRIAVRRRIRTLSAVIFLQSSFRRHLAKLRLRKLHAAFTKFKGHAKKRMIMMRSVRQFHAVLRLQRQMRLFLVRLHFQRSLHEITKVQAVVRGFCARACVRRMHHAAQIIQRRFATFYYSRKWSMQVVHKVRVVQRAVRRWLAMHWYQKKVCQPALHIASVMRRWLARARVQKMHRAACLVQRQVRMFLVRRLMVRMDCAAWLIARNVLRLLTSTKLAREHDSACKMQCMTRSWVARQRVMQMRQASMNVMNGQLAVEQFFQTCQRDKAVLRIQAKWRTFAVIASRSAKSDAATTVQRTIRRKLVVSRANSVNKAAVLLQAVSRMFLVRLRFIHRLRSTIVLQSLYRMHLLRRNYRTAQKAVVLLQRAIRKFMVYRRSRKVEHWKTLRRTLLMWVWSRRWHRLRSHTLLLQRVFRGCLARRLVPRQTVAARAIQICWRRFKVRKEAPRRNRAALVIQAAFRRSMVSQHYARRQSAAALIANVGVHWLQAKRNALVLSAVILLQAHFRRYLTRKAYLKKLRAAGKLETTVRTLQVQEHSEEFLVAIILVQSIVRGRIVVPCRLSRRVAAARKIQKVIRGHIDRKHVQRIRKSYAALRQWILSVGLRQRYCFVHSAIVRIQSWIRACSAEIAYKQLRSTLVHVNLPVVLALQMLRSKQPVVAKQQHAVWKAQLQKVVVSQKVVRGFIVRRNAEKRSRLCTRIQVWFRKHMHNHRRQAFVKIVRFLLADRACRKQMAIYRDPTPHLKATMIQSTFRMFYARRRFVAFVRAMTRIQAMLRGSLIRKAVADLYMPATRIQAWIRPCIASRKYAQFSPGLQFAQARVHARFARDHFCMLRDSAIIIQSMFRMFRQRKSYLDEREAAKKILETLKVVVPQRSMFRKLRASAILIQQFYRAHLKRTGRDVKPVPKVQSPQSNGSPAKEVIPFEKPTVDSAYASSRKASYFANKFRAGTARKPVSLTAARLQGRSATMAGTSSDSLIDDVGDDIVLPPARVGMSSRASERPVSLTPNASSPQSAYRARVGTIDPEYATKTALKLSSSPA
jgi:hypothetical protein